MHDTPPFFVFGKNPTSILSSSVYSLFKDDNETFFICQEKSDGMSGENYKVSRKSNAEGVASRNEYPDFSRQYTKITYLL